MERRQQAGDTGVFVDEQGHVNVDVEGGLPNNEWMPFYSRDLANNPVLKRQSSP